MRHFYFLILLFPILLFAQDKPEGSYTVDINYFYGNIIPHRKSIQHLITEHPEGTIISFNRKTFGAAKCESVFNFPDYGVSFHYQDMKNQALGEMYGLYGHYSFYFLNRNIMFRVGQGVAYNTNPYDKQTNFRNYAYGVHFMPSTYFMLNYNKQDIWQGLGVQAGFMMVHHSNASMRAPNTSTNTLAINLGVNYTFNRKEANIYETGLDAADSTYTEPVKFNAVFRGGFNESDVIGSGQKAYYALGLYADKRISKHSTYQLGVDVFWARYLKEYIRYQSIAYPELNVDGSKDYRKIGLFAGYELRMDRLAPEAQVGYYVYSPFNSTGRLYERIGLKYYIADYVFASVGLKTHGAKAEVMEFGLGIRL